MAARSFASSALAALVVAACPGAFAQGTAGSVYETYTPGPCSPNGQPHGACPQGELVRIRVVPLATGLTNPFHIAFLPDGDMLVTEGPGRLRLIRGGVLDPTPIAGWPVAALRAGTLNSVLVHPQYERNRFVYLSYVKAREDGMTSIGLARGRLANDRLSDVQDVFVADAWIKGGPLASRAEFAPDGTIFLSVNDHDAMNATSDPSVRLLAQELSTDVG
jgi:glucose/arabinose dehydrogenase